MGRLCTIAAVVRLIALDPIQFTRGLFMILSHKHRFIFMHGQKTAGSSITINCNPHLGPRDIQTGVWVDTLKHGGHLNLRALRILLGRYPGQILPCLWASLRHGCPQPDLSPERINKVIKKFYERRAGFHPQTAHPRAWQVKAYDAKAWRNYFKFTVVRNPWEQAVSLYYWQLNLQDLQPRDVSFREFLERFADPERPDPENVRPLVKTNWPIYTIDDDIAVDFIARFEHLEQDLKTIQDRIGIPLVSSVRAKSGVRDTSRALKDYYDRDTLELVRAIYAPEIEYFQYEPGFQIA